MELEMKSKAYQKTMLKKYGICDEGIRIPKTLNFSVDEDANDMHT